MLLSFAGVTATPLAWWKYQKESKQSLITERDFQYGQQLIEGGWGLCNAGEWQTAHYVLESILPDALCAASKQPEAALLAARGLVLQSILQVHQFNVAAMIPLCQQAVLYAKYAGDHTTICAALNGLAVGFKYNQLLESSFQTYLEAVNYCTEQAAPLVKSRIYAGLAASFAQRGYKGEADLYINLAYEHFPEHPEHDPHVLSADHGLYMIAYYHGLMYLALHQPQEALNAFESYKQHLSPSAVPMRNQLEIVNHQSRAAILSNDLDRYIICLQEGMQGALTLKSKKRLNEIVTIFREEVPGEWRHHSRITPFLERYPLLLEDK
jgi:hypothetical protein